MNDHECARTADAIATVDEDGGVAGTRFETMSFGFLEDVFEEGEKGLS